MSLFGLFLVLILLTIAGISTSPLFLPEWWSARRKDTLLVFHMSLTGLFVAGAFVSGAILAWKS